MSKSIKKCKNTRYIIILVITLSLLFLLIILFNRYKLNKNKNKNKNPQIESFYEDSITTSPLATIEPAHTIGILQRCSASPGDLAGMCKDYSNCCKTGSTSKSCICAHPVIQKCQTEYNTCMTDSNYIKKYTPLQLADTCTAISSKCCESYNNINIDSKKFNAPIIKTQKDNLICNMPASNNMNMTEKCMELCETNPNCEAFSINQNNIAVFGCNLFSKVSNTNQNNKDSIIEQLPNYYIKK